MKKFVSWFEKDNLKMVCRDIREVRQAEAEIDAPVDNRNEMNSVDPPEAVTELANRQGVSIYWLRGNQDREHNR